MGIAVAQEWVSCPVNDDVAPENLELTALPLAVGAESQHLRALRPTRSRFIPPHPGRRVGPVVCVVSQEIMPFS